MPLPTPTLLEQGHLAHRPMGALPFTAQDYAQWGLGGDWTWSPAGPELEVVFVLGPAGVEMRSLYGRFSGGLVSDTPGVLALVEREGPPGPPTATWLNLARVDANTLQVVIEAFGGDEDEPTITQVKRRP